MVRLWLAWAAFLVIWAGAAWPARAQEPLIGPDLSVEAALQDLASRAAVVFVGQVVAIQRHTGSGEIKFRVDRPVTGQVSASYTLREWAGLWPPGQWRYTVGERAMVFLHASSGAGFSSAVDGAEGVVPVVGTAEGVPLLDIRRLSTRVLRQVGTPLPSTQAGAIALEDALPLVTNWNRRPLRPPVRRGLPDVPRPATRTPATSVHLPAPFAESGARPGNRILPEGDDAP